LRRPRGLDLRLTQRRHSGELAMNGAVWILSYVLLAFMVLCLTFAVAALYRLVGRPGASSGAVSPLAWPLSTVGPDQPLPELRLSHRPDLSGSRVLRVEEGFCVLVPAAPHAHALISSVQLVAEAWESPLLVVLDAEAAWPSIDTWPTAWRDRVMWAGAGELRTLALRQPVIVFLREGKVVDAAAGLVSPAAVADHFRLVGEPLLVRKEAVSG
jgi:hypothetical protein